MPSLDGSKDLEEGEVCLISYGLRWLRRFDLIDVIGNNLNIKDELVTFDGLEPRIRVGDRDMPLCAFSGYKMRIRRRGLPTPHPALGVLYQAEGIPDKLLILKHDRGFPVRATIVFRGVASDVRGWRNILPMLYQHEWQLLGPAKYPDEIPSAFYDKPVEGGIYGGRDNGGGADWDTEQGHNPEQEF